jgi:hypothetical protein
MKGFCPKRSSFQSFSDNPLPTALTELYQAALVYFYKNHDRSGNKECYEKVIKELQR